MEYKDSSKKLNGKWQNFVEHCIDLYEACKDSDYRKDKIESIREAYRVYKQKEKPGRGPWQDCSNTELPLLTITVDNIEPRIVAGLTGKKPFVNFEMDGLTKKDALTEIVEDWYNGELENTVKINNVASKVTHKVLLEGEVYPIVGYDEDEVLRRDFVFQDVPDPTKTDPSGQVAMRKELVIGEDGLPVTEDKMFGIFKGGRIEFAEYSDVFVPDIDSEWEKTDVIRIVRPTYAELMLNKDKPGYMNIGPDLLPDKSEKREEDDQTPEESVLNKTITGKEVIDCLECCVSYVYQKEGQTDKDIKDWESTRYVGLITKESGILLRMIPLIDLNYKNEHLVKRVRLYSDGSSLYDKMKSIQSGATDLFNMVVNVANICMIPWFLYTDAAGFEGEVSITPGKGIRVDDVSQISFPKFSQNPRSYMIFIEMFMSLWEKLGSIGDIQVGRISEGSKDVTATETMAAIQEGNIKHNYQGLALKEDFVSILRTMYDLYYQKMPYDATFIYRGKDIPVPRHAMRRRYRFKLLGSSDLSNKVLGMQKTESLYKAIRQDPLSNGLKLIEDLVKSHDEDTDPSEYINPMINQFVQIAEQNPEIMQVIQQYLQGKQQQAQQGAQAQQANMAKQTGESMANALVGRLQGNA